MLEEEDQLVNIEPYYYKINNNNYYNREEESEEKGAFLKMNK